MSQKIKTSVEIDGSLTASQIANATTDTDKFLVSDGGTVKYRTGAELVSDLGITSGTASHVQHQVKAGVAINKGQAVYVTGADGTNMIVGLASNASEGTSSKTMGLLNATVSANGFADVITEGLLAGLNTIGANAGDPVWLGTGGNLIYGLVNKPYAPNHLVFIGIVTRVNANNGEIFVKVQNGFELEELHNVLLTGTQNNQLLAYNSSTGLWENKSIGTVLGGTNAQYVKGDGSLSSALNSRLEVNFIATAGQTAFSTPYEIGQIEVYYNGSKLYPDEFIATNGTSVVLVNAATLNAQISIVKYVSAFTTTSIRNETIFTTTSGQTTFSVNYAVGQVDVFYNGAKLNPSEFTATDGTSIVLGFTCAAGESISVISYVNQVSGAVGTANKVAKFTGVASLGDSQIYDNGTSVSVGSPTYITKFNVAGGMYAGSMLFDNNNIATSGLTAMSITTNGSERLKVFGGGNVFIGSSAADAGYKLDVNGTSRISGTFRISSTTPTQEFFSTGNADVWGSIKAEASTGTGGQLVFSTKRNGNTETAKIRVTENGNTLFYPPNSIPIAISGQGAPYYGSNITLSSDTGSTQGANRIWSRYDATGRACFTFETATNTQSYQSDPTNLTYTEYMRLTGGGNLGLGTGNPTAISNYIIHTINGTSGSFTEWQENGSKTFRVGSDLGLGGFVYTQGAYGIRFGTNGTERMQITSSGAITKPYQPAWSVGLSSVQNVVANSPTVIYWNQSSGNDCFIQGGVSLNGSNGRITVPVAGKYMLFSSIRTEATGATAGTNLNIRRNGAIILRYYVGGSVISAGSYMNIETRPVIINCAANDYIDFYFDSPPGSFNISETSNTVVRFGGYLVG
mgnify:CR=1 FL=1